MRSLINRKTVTGEIEEVNGFGTSCIAYFTYRSIVFGWEIKSRGVLLHTSWPEYYIGEKLRQELRHLETLIEDRFEEIGL